MSNRRPRPVRLALAALALVVVGALGVSASAFGRSDAKSCGTVTLDENAWAGATANVYVVKYVLEKNLGCKVNIEKLPESTPLFHQVLPRPNGTLFLPARALERGAWLAAGIGGNLQAHQQLDIALETARGRLGSTAGAVGRPE